MLGSKLDIMSTGWLNLVFANRNQAYGAYQLRQENDRTTNKALAIAVSIFLFVLATPTIANIIRGYIPAAEPKFRSIPVTTLPPPVEPKKEIVPPAQEAARPRENTIRDVPPVVTIDRLAHVDPPTEDQLRDATPGPKTLTGDPGAPPDVGEDHGTGDPNKLITEAPDKVFIAVEVEPTPIVGMDNYYKFLGKKINYPNTAKEAGTQGNVILTFVVEPDGSLSNIKALRDPGNGLADEAIRVLKIAPHWNPGVQNGKKVRVQYTIPVNFTLGEQ